jgi:hypothetical protein
MSHGNSAPAINDIPVKRRHPLERALVWGLIAALFSLASVETWSRFSYQRAYDHLGHRLEVGDEQSAEALDAAGVQSFLGGRQPFRTEDFARAGKMISNGATHLEVYSWFTFNPVHRRELFVYYAASGPAGKDHPQVISIQAVEEEPFPLPEQGERQIVTREANAGTGRSSRFMNASRLQQAAGRMSAGMPAGAGQTGIPGTGPQAGHSTLPGGATSAQADSDQPANAADPNERDQLSKPEPDTGE